MSVGKKILQVRLESKRTQQEVANLTGLAVSYLSRLENDRLNPSLRTLTKISTALGVPLASFFDPGPTLELGDRCPVSSSGRCILDQLHVGRGRKPKAPGRRPKTPLEGYSTRQLEILRMCNFLLHHGDKEIVTSLSAVIRSMLALATSKDRSKLRKSQ